jgi:hypothetical protein
MLINVFGTPEETADAVGDVHPETAAEVLHRVSTSLGAGDLSFIIAISVALSDNVLSSVSENSNDNRRFLTQRFLASFYDAALNHMPSEESQAFIKVFDDVNLIFPHAKSVLTRFLVVRKLGRRLRPYFAAWRHTNQIFMVSWQHYTIISWVNAPSMSPLHPHERKTMMRIGLSSSNN